MLKVYLGSKIRQVHRTKIVSLLSIFKAALLIPMRTLWGSITSTTGGTFLILICMKLDKNTHNKTVIHLKLKKKKKKKVNIEMDRLVFHPDPLSLD